MLSVAYLNFKNWPLLIFLYLNGLESLSKEKRAWILQVELTRNFQLSFIEFVIIHA